jgi:membrane-associated phospholipid phosphatase
MTPFDAALALVLATLSYMGGYRVYFFLQAQTHGRSVSLPAWLTVVDERIPRRAGWVWIYTALYYPMVVIGAVISSHDLRQFAYTVGIYIVLLVVLTAAYFAKPVRTPEHWRAFQHTASVHHRLLAWVQRIDGANNCFPSGHAAISVLTGYLLVGPLGLVPGVAYALLVCLSCLFCKQHYLIDVLGGAVLGAGCAWLHHALVAAV